MKVIYKYPLTEAVLEAGQIQISVGAKIRAFQMQGGVPCIWAEVDNEAKLESRIIHILGTGHPFEDVGEYVGTYQSAGGFLVWHVYIK
jgi:hypothetical protein